MLKNSDNLQYDVLGYCVDHDLPRVIGGVDYIETKGTKKYYTVIIHDIGMNYRTNDVIIKFEKGEL